MKKLTFCMALLALGAIMFAGCGGGNGTSTDNGADTMEGTTGDGAGDDMSNDVESEGPGDGVYP